MSTATVAEVIAQLRAEGKSDDEVATILRVSRLPLPEGFHHHTRVSVRSIMGEDESGFRPDGHQGGATR